MTRTTPRRPSIFEGVRQPHKKLDYRRRKKRKLFIIFLFKVKNAHSFIFQQDLLFKETCKKTYAFFCGMRKTRLSSFPDFFKHKPRIKIEKLSFVYKSFFQCFKKKVNQTQTFKKDTLSFQSLPLLQHKKLTPLLF